MSIVLALALAVALLHYRAAAKDADSRARAFELHNLALCEERDDALAEVALHRKAAEIRNRAHLEQLLLAGVGGLFARARTLRRGEREVVKA